MHAQGNDRGIVPGYGGHTVALVGIDVYDPDGPDQPIGLYFVQSDHDIVQNTESVSEIAVSVVSPSAKVEAESGIHGHLAGLKGSGQSFE